MMPTIWLMVTTSAGWNNDAGYVTGSTAPVLSVNTKTGAVVLTAADIGARLLATTSANWLMTRATSPVERFPRVLHCGPAVAARFIQPI